MFYSVWKYLDEYLQMVNMELLPEIIKILQDNLPVIITIGLSILSVILGKKYREIKKIITYMLGVLNAINLAIADDDITLEEIQVIIKRINAYDPDE